MGYRHRVLRPEGKDVLIMSSKGQAVKCSSARFVWHGGLQQFLHYSLFNPCSAKLLRCAGPSIACSSKDSHWVLALRRQFLSETPIAQHSCRKQHSGVLHARRQQQVKCIERVQNPMLWSRFALRRGELNDKHGAQHEMDTTLFHGTDKSICEAVVNEGFDIRVAKAGALGTGELLPVFAGRCNHGTLSLHERRLSGAYTGKRALSSPAPPDLQSSEFMPAHPTTFLQLQA